MEKVAEENPCDYLFKMADKFGLARPHFALIHAEGPSHNPVLTMEATFHNLTQRGRGSSKKEAKRWAALAVIAQLDLTTLTAEGSSPCRELRRGKKRKLPEPPIQDQSGQNLTAKHNTDQFQATLGYHVGAESAQTASWTYPLAPFTPSDDLFRQKLRQIQPSQASIEQLMSMVNHVERALLSVAKGWDMEPSNPILGASRVGGLAQGSLITKDQTVSIVVMAQDRPTHPFLELLHQKLDRELSIVSNTNEYSCQVMPEKSGMTIVPINPNHLNHFSLNITVTSLKWRGIPNDSEESGTPDLSARQGLKALAEIRRHRWFETCLRPLPFGIDIVQVLRDLAHRDPVLSVLSDWSLELLTERALYCNMEPLSPFRNLLRVFEILASGLILPGGSGLFDPCEYEPVDVLDYLTPQHCDDITRTAQAFVRQMVFRQIHKVLDLPAPKVKPQRAFPPRRSGITGTTLPFVSSEHYPSVGHSLSADTCHREESIKPKLTEALQAKVLLEMKEVVTDL